MKTVCKLRVGTQIAVGFGQSYELCDGEKVLSASPALQVYVTGTRNDIKKQVKDCKVERGLSQR